MSAADLVLTGGPITIGDSTLPDAEAIAISRGRVSAVGSVADVDALRGDRTTVVQLEGRRVVPGLIDSHVHVVRAGLSWQDEIRWGDVETLREALAMVEAAAHKPGTTEVVVVGGWHPTQFSEKRGPTPAELNKIAPDTAVYVQQLYDFAALNSEALARCGITADSELPVEGEIERDSNGSPTGIIRGQPAFAYCLKLLSQQTFDRQVANTIAMQRELNAYGLTGAIDLGGVSRMGPDAYRAVFEVQRRAQMSLRTRLYMHPQGPPAELDQIRDYARHVHRGFGDPMLSTIGIGEILFKQYYDGPGLKPVSASDSLKAELGEATRLLIENGLPINIHAIHNESLSSILDVWEEVHRETPLNELRFSFSHADAISHENLLRAREMGIGMLVQDRMGMRTLDSAKAWGEEAVRHAPPLKTMVEMGLKVGGGTDATVAAPINPWRSIWWMVTGKPLDGGIARSASECLSRAEALQVYTSGSAWFSFDDDELGTLEVGKQADLAVLTSDYFSIPEDEIPQIRSALTLVGGVVVHASEEFEYAAAGQLNTHKH